ncbi:MAG: long-chain fatty acid--CoA ligase [Anaerolineae bacterium]|nr:MAG: long-chain fatty acid--CoA ligase [Anaerolineae bacterium]
MRRPWFRFYDEGVPLSLTYPSITVSDFLRRSAERYPDQVATVFLGARLTYRKLKEQVDRLAASLADLGVTQGDRVAVLLPNCPQAIIAYYATLSLGAVAVMTNPLYVERELIHQWCDAGVETAVILDQLWPRVEKVRRQTPLRRVIVTGIQDYLPFPKNLLYPLKARRDGTWVQTPRQGGLFSFKRLIRRASTPPPVDVSPDDLACLQYTGGTTGLPKGAMLTHRNLVASVTQIRQFLLQGHDDATDKAIAILPLFHAYGMNGVMNLGLHLAATLVLLPLFDINMLMEAIRTERPTFFLGVPALYSAVLNHPGGDKIDLSSIRVCFSGAAPLPVEVIEQFEARTGARIVEAYGMTETASVTHVNPRRGLRKVGSIGVPVVGTDARVVDLETGTRDLPPGQAGELIVKGPQVTQGYWNDPAETARILRDGWIYTGDVARMDEDGYFYIEDRKKDLIITGGYNVYPREVEEVLYQHPKVLEAAVVGVPSRVRGERIKAFVVLKNGTAARASEIVEFCKERLATYKVPRAIVFRDKLPKSLAGKILRRVLREEELARLSEKER